MDDTSREGWAPEIRDRVTLAEVIDRAFDYRGDVTLIRTDGSEIVGYLFNRSRDAAEPFVQVFERGEDHARTIPYAEIRAIRFTGKDTAAGNSYAAWRRSRDAGKSGVKSDAASLQGA